MELIPVELPLMGEGVVEATVVKWLKGVGERIEEDEAIVEVSTDKVDTEISAPAAGYLLKTYIEEGQIAEVHSVMAYLGETVDAKAPDSAPKAAVSTETQQSTQSSSTSQSTTEEDDFEQDSPTIKRSTPIARTVAKAFNIDINGVKGHGVGGRVTKRDLNRFLEATRLSAFEGFEKEHSEYARQSTKTVGDQEFLDGVPVTREPMSKMRKITAEHMVRSVRTSPHVTTTFEMNYHHIFEHRKKYNEAFQKENDGVKLTYTYYTAFACVQTLKRHPLVNASIDGDDILLKENINLGLAVAIDSGLIVPVIEKAESMSFREFCHAANDIIFRSRNKKLTPNDVLGGTFSITNPGLFGSVHSSPIINQPQVAILDLGAIVRRPIVGKDDEIVIRPLANIGITFDHRLIDGEGGAKFLADLKTELETNDFDVS